MNDEITPEQKNEFVIEALRIAGFIKNPEFPVYTQEHGMKTIVVDLSAGTSVYFTIDKNKVVIDDEYNTLTKVSEMLIKAEGGDMPVKTEADMVVNVKKSRDPSSAPAYEPKHEVEPNGHIETRPAEVIHSTAVPTPFQPQGMMIMDIMPGLAEYGGIKIGGKGEEKKSQKSGQMYRLPVKYDHFVIQTKIKDDAGNFIIDPIMKKWGFGGTVEDGPKELEIYLLYDEPTSNFLTSYRQYKGGKCLCSGNGIDAVKADGSKIKCDTTTCTIFKSKQCKPNGILSVILKDAPVLGGVYKFRTTSFNSIRQILSSMFFIQSATGGHLANIPLKMTLTPKTVNPIDSPTAQTVYIVNIVFPGNIDDLHEKTLDLVKERASMRTEILRIEAQAKLAICAPETSDDIQDVEAEFYPKSVNEERT